MAHLFDALARFVFRFRWPVLAACMLVAIAGAALGLGVEKRLYGSVAEIPGAASQQVATISRSEFARPIGAMAVVTMRSERYRFIDPAFEIGIHAVRERLEPLPLVKRLVLPGQGSPFSRGRGLDAVGGPRLVARDGHTVAILVGLDVPSAQEAERLTPVLREALAPALKGFRNADPDAEMAVTGAGALAYDLAQHGASDMARVESFVLPATLLILVLAFGALAAAAVSLAMGMLATAAAMGGIAIAADVTPLAIVVQNVATMLGLAVGIDYALLMVGRFREGLARGLGTEDALAEAMRTAGVAVACSGGTVMIGLAGLAFTPAILPRSIGTGGAIVVAAGVLMALTLLPALLAVLGPRIDAPVSLRRSVVALGAGARWGAWAGWVSARALPLAAAGLVLMAALSAPIALIRTDYGTSSLLPRTDLEFQKGLDHLALMGRKNAYAPVELVVTADQGAILEPAGLEALLALSRTLRADPRVRDVIGPVDVREGWPEARYRKLYKHWRAARALAPTAFDAFISRDGRRALVQVVAADALRFEQIQGLTRDLRSLPAPPGVSILVGGQAALYNDTHEALVAAVPGMIAFVVGATFLALAIAYRSLLVPLKATVLNLLSVGAGVGALVVLFQFGWGQVPLQLQEPTGGVPPGILSTIFCVVFGLSMDYEVFLLSRIKEAYDETGDNAKAIEAGLAATGGVITAAALIMATVFAGFAGVRLVMVQMLGVGLAVAVLVDATVVRVLLAPALMKLAGDWNWWPGGRRAP